MKKEKIEIDLYEKGDIVLTGDGIAKISRNWSSKEEDIKNLRLIENFKLD